MKDGRSPQCPACKAKFSHDSSLMLCKKCGLPDEVLVQGSRAIARWKRKPVISPLNSETVFVDGMSKRQRKASRAAGRQRRRNKPGRAGVKSASR